MLFGVGKDGLFALPQPTFLALNGGFSPYLQTTLEASLIKIIEGTNKNLYCITLNKNNSQILLIIFQKWANVIIVIKLMKASIKFNFKELKKKYNAEEESK